MTSRFSHAHLDGVGIDGTIQEPDIIGTCIKICLALVICHRLLIYQVLRNQTLNIFYIYNLECNPGCMQTSCHNGGTCRLTAQGMECVCLPGFGGSQCRIGMDSCLIMVLCVGV